MSTADLDLTLFDLRSRARSALDRALQLTRAYGNELEVERCQPAATAPTSLQGASSGAEAHSQAGLASACLPPLPEDSAAQISIEGSRNAGVACSALPAEACNHGSLLHACHGEKAHHDRWWEDVDRSSSSSSDCIGLPSASSADFAQPSEDQETSPCSQEDGSHTTPNASSNLNESATHRTTKHGLSHTGHAVDDKDPAPDAAELRLPDLAEPSQPVSELAERLDAVQRQQADTVDQLIQHRQEQLRLRRQQLAALACLLRTEAELLAVNAENQGGAVAQAIVLLEDCLDNVQLAGAALQSAHAAGTTTGCGDICSLSQTVAEADSRAEEVSSLARQLLLLMRSQMMLTAGNAVRDPYHQHAPGLEASELDSMPTLLCSLDHPLLETPDKCSICLSFFQAQDRLRLLPCAHFHHQACVDEWLLTRATCPLCNQHVRSRVSA